MDPEVTLVTWHDRQPIQLLSAHLEHHTGEGISHLVLLECTDPMIAAAEHVCRKKGIRCRRVEAINWKYEVAAAGANWTALLRTEFFLSRSQGITGWARAAQEAGSSSVAAWLVDQVAPRGRLVAASASPWQDFPLQCSLTQHFGGDAEIVWLASTPDWWLHHHIAAHPVKSAMHNFGWHQASLAAVEGRLAHAKKSGENPWPWVRAQGALREGRLDILDILLSRHWIEGWFDYPELYSAAAELIVEGGRAYEVGVWHGRSIIALADMVRAHGKCARLSGVDPFSDTGQFIPGTYFSEWLSIFNANNEFAGGAVEALTATSIEAAGSVNDGSASFVFIDGDHLYDAVQQDMMAWWPKLREGGVMAGHDYAHLDWPDVKPAVDDWAEARGLEVHAEKPRTWWIQKPGGADRFRVRRKEVDVRVPVMHACNPAIGRDPITGKLLFVFKSSGPRWNNPRLWCAELDPDSGELTEVPRQLRLGPDHLAYEDPRLFEYQGRLWLSFIHGDYNLPVKNRVAVCPLEYTGGRFQSACTPVVFPSPVSQDREKEKNWIMHEHDGQLMAVYSMAPWHLLNLDPVRGEILNQTITSDSLSWGYGEPRGTSSFVAMPGGRLWTLFHSHCGWPDPGGKRYFAGLLEVSNETLRPLRQSYTPLLREPAPEPAWMGYHVVWPSGGVLHGDDLLISYGRNDHSCHLAWLAVDRLESKLYPVGQ